MIYLDNAAGTPIRKEVLGVVEKAMEKYYANPSALHKLGKGAKEQLEKARGIIGFILGVDKKDKIIFTASGTESVNLAVKGFALANRDKGKHIITTSIEHKSVLEACSSLKKQGFNVTYLPVDKNGLVNVDELKKAITKDTILISVHYANNEIGTIQPIKEISEIARKNKIVFHSDACQAGFLNLNVGSIGVDMLTLNSSKIYGPRGAALLYVKDGLVLKPLMEGGGQEYSLRSGTENLPAIMGFAKALELAQKEKEKENKRLIALRDMLIKGIMTISDTYLNGHPKNRLANNVNVSFKDVDGETLLMHLDEKRIYASSGSACSSNVTKLSNVAEHSNAVMISHVLLALGVDESLARGTIRFSLGKETSEKDVKKVVAVLREVVDSLRKV
jgi:cysteine desulfurase